MSKALEGEHLCIKHQGNHSHYAEHNCTICQLQSQLAASEEARKKLGSKFDALKMKHDLMLPIAKNLEKTLEAAEQRIKESQDQEPVGVVASSVFGDIQWTKKGAELLIGSKLYCEPVIQPELEKLQRENAELQRRVAELEKDTSIAKGRGK